MAIDVEHYYRTYGPMVLRRCRRLLNNEQEAVDAMQDVFVQVIHHQGRLVPDAASRLLYRIATNGCLNRLRSRRRKPEDANDELVQRIAQDDDLERRGAAGQLLSQLFGSEAISTRTIATLHFADGLTLAEVADEVGMSVSGVRKRLRGLREKLVDLEAGRSSANE